MLKVGHYTDLLRQVNELKRQLHLVGKVHSNRHLFLFDFPTDVIRYLSMYRLARIKEKKRSFRLVKGEVVVTDHGRPSMMNCPDSRPRADAFPTSARGWHG